jgi:hypothetical protein
VMSELDVAQRLLFRDFLTRHVGRGRHVVGLQLARSIG